MTTVELLPVQLAGKVLRISTSTLQRFDERELRLALREHGSGSHSRRSKHRLGNTGTLVLITNASAGETFVLTPAEERALSGSSKMFAPTRRKKGAGGLPRRSIR